MTKAAQLMSDEVVTCRIGDTLQRAAQLMWDRDVGCLPVVDEAKRLLGMLTDRDICMSAYARDQPLRDIPVTVAMATRVFACGADDEIADVETMMAEHQVRRVPVLDPSGHVMGVLSIDDIAGAAGTARDIAEHDVVSTLQAVSGKAPALDDPCC